MPTWTESEFEIMYINPDGSIVSGFKAYEGAHAVTVYENWILPYSVIGLLL
jgi:hypothetical protein